MIVEFHLSLEGSIVCWYAQHDIGIFRTFQELVDKFKELFEVKIGPTEVLREYYSLQQQLEESVVEFSLQFHVVQGLMDTAPSEEM
jgi:hypothetical protein